VSQAEFSIAKIARGYTNFEDVYQGQAVDVPVFLSDKVSGKDDLALDSYGKLKAQYDRNGGFGGGLTAADNGISPFLVAGIPVPMGSLVSVLLPNVPGSFDGGVTPALTYHLIWRMRSVGKFRTDRAPYHLAFDGKGQSDDGSLDVGPVGAAKFAGASEIRQLIVGSQEVIRFPQTPSSGAWAEENLWALAQNTQVTTQLKRPLFPAFGGTEVAEGDIQQGYLKNGQGNFPLYVPYLTRAMGDELLVAVTAVSDPAATTWDFDGAHFNVSLAFGRAGYVTGKSQLATPLKPNPQIGVYVMTGVGPLRSTPCRILISVRWWASWWPRPERSGPESTASTSPFLRPS
jgi:hypothetical protein